jgi:molybdopterin-containing oxidoreductase family membrane subunit
MTLRSTTGNSKLFFLWVAGLLVLILVGLFGAYQVLTEGLIVTNLTDLVPWGLWITVDLSSIAMSAGAFSLCAIVYLVGIKRYEPVARTATFIGIIGYSMAMLCLFMDIGRPDRFWHGFVFWNTHSVLWEVTMCVGLYFSVLMLELMPIIGRNGWMKRSSPWLALRMSSVHRIAPILALLGLAFSLLHQSSLGATYAVIQARPAWYRPSISVLFIFSAVIGGISLTILASMLASSFSSRVRTNDHLLERLSRVIGWVLVAYLYFRLWDAFAMTYTYQPGRTEALQMLTKGSLAFNFWIGEILLGAVIPIAILIHGRWRRNPWLRMLALFMVVIGVVAYRWDINMVGQLIVLTYLPQEIVARYTTYFPSAVEFAIATGIVAYGLLAFTFGARYLRVVDHTQQSDHAPAPSSPTRVRVPSP